MTERSGKPSNLHRDGDRLLQLLIFNEEYLVGVCHQRASITSLPFVHTARRSYRLNDPVRPPDCGDAAGSPAAMPREAVQTLSFRGRRSRNKVSVGEPAEGSLPVFPTTHLCIVGSADGANAPDPSQHKRERKLSVCLKPPQGGGGPQAPLDSEKRGLVGFGRWDATPACA